MKLIYIVERYFIHLCTRMYTAILIRVSNMNFFSYYDFENHLIL